LAVGVLAGLVWPKLASLLAPLLAPTVFVVLTLTAVRADWHDIAAYVRRPAAPATVVIWVLLVSPVVTLLVARALHLPPPLVTAVVLMAAAPPVMASLAFALLLRLDLAMSVISTFVATVLVPVSLPPMALMLLDLEIEMNVVEFMLRLATLTVGAFALAAILRRLVPASRIQAIAPQIDGVAVLVLVLFAIAIMDGVRDAMLMRPDYVALTLVTAFGANVGLQALGSLLFLSLGRRRALTAGFVSGNRNMALVLAALAGSADFDVTLYFAIGQIPLYMLPALLAPLYRRLLKT